MAINFFFYIIPFPGGDICVSVVTMIVVEYAIHDDCQGQLRMGSSVPTLVLIVLSDEAILST